MSEAVTVPVIAGSGTNDTAHSVELTRAAEQAGAAGILAVTPYYSRPPQAGLDAHFRAVAAATDLPVMIYDIPIRTGRKVAHETLSGWPARCRPSSASRTPPATRPDRPGWSPRRPTASTSTAATTP